MIDQKKVIKAWEIFRDSNPYGICEGKEFMAINEPEYCMGQMIEDTIAMLKEQEDLLGIQQTADSITFISTGTAKQGEERGIMLGKSWMHEWLKKELLHRGLLTDEIRSVFDDAKRI